MWILQELWKRFIRLLHRIAEENRKQFHGRPPNPYTMNRQITLKPRKKK